MRGRYNLTRDTTTIEMHIHTETEKAILVSDDGDEKRAVWLPKSQIKYSKNRSGFYDVEMPSSLALEKRLS